MSVPRTGTEGMPIRRYTEAGYSFVMFLSSFPTWSIAVIQDIPSATLVAFVSCKK